MTHVTKETAILLKEKGFDVPTDYVYAYSEGDMTISAPALHEAAEWLRETKEVHVYVSTKDVKWAYTIEDIKIGKILSNSFWHFDTHDIALEAGIVHALKNYVK